MGDSVITVVAIFLAAILMFVFPLMSVAERNDDIAQLSAQTITAEFVDNARAIGKITMEDYTKFVNKLSSTGNAYDIEMEVKVLDENIGKKSAWTNKQVIGENVYYSIYTSQILEVLTDETSNGVYSMKQGDYFSVSIKNTNQTIAQLLRSFFYSIAGKDTYQVAAQHSGMVTSTGIN